MEVGVNFDIIRNHINEKDGFSCNIDEVDICSLFNVHIANSRMVVKGNPYDIDLII